MDRAELIMELDRIIDVGIVNAKHDSDVLRHIRKLLKDPEPKLLTADEIRALPRGSVVWIEYFNGEQQRSTQLVASLKCGDGSLVDEETLLFDAFEKDMKPDAEGDCWRFWNAEPTETQRNAVPWP